MSHDWPLYRGTKMLKATPMTKAEYCLLRNWDVPADEDPAERGYTVEYQDGGKPNLAGFEGYVSWSPADVFERAYHRIGTHVDRMKLEATELLERLDKLAQFIQNNPAFAQLEMNQRTMLTAQRDAMQTYYTILAARIDGESVEEQTSGFVRDEPVVAVETAE